MTSNHAIVLDHISFGVRSIAECVDYLEGELGAQLADNGPAPAFNWAQWRLARGARIELIEPRGADGFLHRFIATRGPGLHHITFKVSSLPQIAARARALGYAVTGYDDSHADWKECFLHPKQALGVVIQLAEAHPELWTGPTQTLQLPRSVATRPEPADVHSLLMTAPDAALVLRQFEQLLGGSCEREADTLLFSWPDSPHRIAVELDDSCAAGPKEVRVTSTGRLAAGSAALFGTPIVQRDLQGAR